MTLLAAFFCLACTAFAQSTDEEAIKQVIRAETEAFFSHNLDAWKATWQHDPKIKRIFMSSNGITTTTGWDSVHAQQERYFKQSVTATPVQLANENFAITTNGTMAWVDYDQQINMSGMDTANGNGRTHEYRVLIKEGDAWKIATQITTFPQSFSNNPQAIENNLNSTGYQLLSANKVNDAIEVFKLNVKLFPNSWNTYDSLGEAYALAGNKKLAIENYEKSIKLNPKSESGPPALAKLKGK
jgi:tetratricopeptide (TPR) repeat protein